MKRHFLGLALSIVLVVGLGVGTAFSATVGLRTLDGKTEITVDPCTTFDVELYLELTPEESELIEATGIVGYTVDILWDPLVELVDFDMGPPYTFVDVKDGTGASVGTPWVGVELDLSGYIFGTAVTVSHVLETLYLHCLGPGDTILLAMAHFGDRDFALADGTYLEGLTTIVYEGITIHQTPIPASILLLGSGLLGLFGVYRLRRK